jgi:stearoyl-CoA desaturase (delta-9 desaturase)
MPRGYLKKPSGLCARLQCMTRAERTANMIGVVVPFLGLLAAIVLLWNRAVDATDLAILAVTYLLFGFGVTVGYHRLLTHRGFQTYRGLQYMWAVLGGMGLQGSVLDWVADHRKHHAHTDTDGDPHSPHVGHGHGLAGLWHAHTGWLFETHGQADWKKYAAELYEDTGMRRINRAFPWLAFLSLAIPTVLGWVLHGYTVQGALRGLVWGGLVRAFFLHHVTWSINSVCHYFGRRRFAIEDHSTNVFWLALPSLGEAWHHNHHAFPRSAAHGLKRWELDPSALLIRAMKRLGLAWNVVQIAPERQAAKLVGAAPPPKPAPPVPEREPAGVS